MKETYANIQGLLKK